MSRSMLLAGLVLAFVFSSARAGDDAPRPVRIPLALQHGLPTTTRATVAGKPLTLVLDAGSYQVVGLKTSVLGRLPVRFTGDTESSGDADGHVFTSRIFHAEQLVAGTLVATQFDGNELVGGGKAALPQDGLIGFGLLGRYQMVFDEPGGELRLYPSSAPGVLTRECGSEGGPLRMERGVMVSDVQTGHGVFRVQWDTGAAEDVLRPSSVAGRIKDADLLRRLAFQQFDVAGHPAGPHEFMLRQFTAPDVDAVLGTGFFSKHVVCLDPSRGRVAFR